MKKGIGKKWISLLVGAVLVSESTGGGLMQPVKTAASEMQTESFSETEFSAAEYLEEPQTIQPWTEPTVDQEWMEPSVTEPFVTEAPVTEPFVTEPLVTEAPMTEPFVIEPLVTEAPVTEPPVTEPPVTEPPMTEPPVTEPPMTEAPVTEPPMTEPPVTEPLVTEPPMTELPVIEPETTQMQTTEEVMVEEKTTVEKITEEETTEEETTEEAVTEEETTEEETTEEETTEEEATEEETTEEEITEEETTEEETTEEELIEDDAEVVKEEALNQYGSVYGSNVSMYRDHSQNSPEDCKIGSGKRVFVLSQVLMSDDMLWYQIMFTEGDTAYSGYVESQYVSLEGNIYAGTYESNLALFPSDYQEMLKKLHAQHPTWIFQPFFTNLNWSDVISNEMYPERNQVISEWPTGWKSMDSADYDWATDTWKIVSPPNWITASKAIVQYYVDPRNFMNETDIFMFEVMTFDKSFQSKKAVEKVLANTFMDNKVVDTIKEEVKDEDTNKVIIIEKKITYAEAFYKIGSEYDMNPMMLASRVVQEQGLGTSPLISGTYPGYEGLYNYFNYGAYGSTWEEIYKNGLEEAKTGTQVTGGAWNTRYKALLGGAVKLSANFIHQGQNTLYLQKWDVDATDDSQSLYWHQYMGNVNAPLSEGRKTMNSYKSLGLLEEAFVFRIPVYKNMPSTPAEDPSDFKNPNNYLNSITVSDGTLSPAFSYDQTSYTWNISNALSSASVKAKTASSSAKVSGAGTIDLSKTKTISIVVTAEDGTKRTYTLTIKTQDPTPAPTLEMPVVKTATNNNRVTVTWNSIKNAEGYRIFRRVGGSGVWTILATRTANRGCSYTDATGASGTKYMYTVRAYRVVEGSVVWSRFDGVYGYTCPAAPAVSSVTSVSASAMKITWGAVTGAEGYRIYRHVTGGGWVSIGYSKETAFIDRTAKSGIDYYYTIRAYMTNGSTVYWSPYYSNPTPYKTNPAAVKLVSAKVNSDASVTVSWEKSAAADGYKVYRMGSNNKWVAQSVISGKNTTTYVDKTAMPCETFYYTVRAYQMVGSVVALSAYQTPGVSCIKELKVPLITSLTQPTNNSVHLTWSAVEGAAGYRIFMKPSGGSWKILSTIAASAGTTYTDSAPLRGTTCYYTVRAYRKVSGVTHWSGFIYEKITVK